MSTILLILLAAGLSFRAYMIVSNEKRMRKVFTRFTHQRELRAYSEAAPRFSLAQKKAPRAVLLLHGYIVSPRMFDPLIEKLQEDGIPHYAPLLYGHGLDNFSGLVNVHGSDWMREALYAFDLLSEVAEEVDIIGYSNGGALAAYIAMHRENVGHLKLVAPNLVSAKGQKLTRWLLSTPILSHLYRWLLPVISVKTSEKMIDAQPNEEVIDPHVKENAFVYSAYSSQGAKALFEVQDALDLKHAKMKRCSLFLGRFDQYVDNEGIEKVLREGGCEYALHVMQSDHFFFMSYERDAQWQSINNS